MSLRRKYQITLVHQDPKTPTQPPPSPVGYNALLGRWFGLIFFGLMLASYFSFVSR